MTRRLMGEALIKAMIVAETSPFIDPAWRRNRHPSRPGDLGVQPDQLLLS